MTTSPPRHLTTVLLALLLLTPTTALATQRSAVAADTPPPVGVVRDGNQLHVRGKPSRTGHTVQLRGRLRVITGEGGARDQYRVASGARSVPVTLPDLDPGLISPAATFSGSVAAAEGVSTSDLSERTPAAVVTATITPQAATAPPDRRLLLAVMTNRGAVPTDTEILTTAQSVADYWLDESDGAIASFTTSTTVKHYETARTSSTNSCGLDPNDPDFAALGDEARSQYPTAGAFDTVVVVIPNACRTSSVAGISTGGVTFNTGNASIESTIGHEEGHELGLGHANVGSCASSCSGEEYGDRMSIMGSGLSGAVNQLTALNSAFRSRLGWTQPGEETEVALPTTESTLTRDVTLLPRAGTAGVRSIRVPDPDAAGTYYIEYRRSQGRDSGSALDGPAWCCASYHPGVSMVYQPTGTNVSWMHPAGPGGEFALGLDDGTYTSPSGGLVLDVLQDNGAAGVLVRVTVLSSRPAFTSSPKPTIVGPAVPGELVGSDLGTWSPAYDAVQYQWNLDGVPVAEWWARTENYSIPAGDLGRQLSLTVTARKAGYRTTRLTSDPVTVGWVTPQTPTIYPANKPWVGINMTALAGNWGPDVSFTYKWYAGSGTTPVGTGQDLVLTSAMLGKPIRVTVTGKSHGQTESRTSADTAPVQLTPLTSSTPTITGAAVVSRALKAATGTWTAGTTFAYRWLANGIAVPGATASTFVPTAAESAKTIKVEVAGTRAGYARTVRTSAATTAVTYAAWAPVQPVLSGTPRYPSALSTAPFWGSEGSYAYRWLNNGVAISGATASRFQPTAAMVGHVISVRVTGTAPDTTQTLLTSPGARIARGVLRAPTPSISGSARVGRTLTAVPHSWTTGTSLRYQWYAGSSAISRATLRTYTLPRAAKGKQIRVRVTGGKSGYTTVAKYSARTSKVS